MPTPLQGSLLDGFEDIALGPLDGIRRTTLAGGAWVDLLPGWLRGADPLFDRLAADVPWRADRRQMYDRMVDVPRLLRFYEQGQALPDPALDEARTALSEHYSGELGEPFTTTGLCYYRNGNDSVAWHGDTSGRGATDDTMVAIVSVGAARALLLRPRGGRVHSCPMPTDSGGRDRRCPRCRSGRPELDSIAGRRTLGGGESLRYQLGHGDLIVMGGSCQRTWEHAIPKTRRPVGPRISIQFRPRGVR